MRFVVWIFFALVVGLVGSLALRVVSRTGGDPRENYDRALRLVRGAEPDLPGALDELDYALRVARAEEDHAAVEGPFHDLIGEILTLRGEVYTKMEIPMLGQARTDFETVLEDYRGDDVDVQVQLAGVLIESEELDAAMLLLDDVLAKDATRADAWTLKSRALVVRAEEKLAEAAEECQSALPDRAAREAARLLEHSSGLPLEHPRRVMMLHELRELFGPLDEAAARNALVMADQASEYVTDARAALAESFLDQPSRDSLYDFLTLLDRSGRDDLCIDFGLAAVNEGPANGNHRFVRVLMQSLLDEGRARTAVEVVNRYYRRGVVPDKDFYKVWSQALYLDERWNNLVFVGNSMMRASVDDAGRSVANYFIGMSHARQDKFKEALVPLQKYTGQIPTEPVPGALPLAWQMLARCMEEKGQATGEKAALRGALRMSPDGVEDPGAAWLRLADLIEETEKKDGLADILDALTHAMRLDPSRTRALMGRWREVGAEVMTSSRTELELVYNRLVASGRLVPEGRISPYELYEIARRHRADDRPSGVAACCRKLLVTYPGFLPALDLYIEAAFQMNDQEEAARALFARIKRAGPDPETVARLDALPPGILDVDQRMELMTLDPEHTGRLAVVRGLREAGRSYEALLGFETVPEETLSDRSRHLKAVVAHDLRRWGLARDNLAAIPPDSPLYAEALHLRLDVAVRTRDTAVLQELIDLVASRDAPDVDALLAVSEQMLLAELHDEARALLGRLDERPDTRDGRVMLRLAMACWLDGDLREADEHIARAEAFLTDGSPELGLLIRAVDRREWHELPWLVSDLQAADFTPSLLQAAALDALREDADGARRLAAQGRARDPDEALWTVIEAALDLLTGLPPEADPSDEDELVFSLIGNGRGERDPRQMLVRILALEHPTWTAFVTAELSGTRVPAPGSMWAGYLAARGYERRGDLDEAGNRVRDVLDQWGSFDPGWDLVERAVAAGLERPDQPRLLRIQQQRRRAQGDGRTPHSVADLRVRARVLSEDGEHEDAMLAIEEALEIDPDDPESLLVLGHLHRKNFDWKPALLAMSQACAQREPASDDYMVGDFLDLIAEVNAAAPDLAGVVRAELLKLDERFPDDPLVLLELARSDLDDGSLAPEIRLARALKRLAAFRARIAGTPLEDLRGGATERWMEFYLERTPQAAHELVQEQLQMLPESIDMWRLLGHTQVALGEREAAIETYDILLRMLPEAATARAIARLLAETGEDHKRVQKLIDQTATLERTRARDFDLQLIQARSFVNDLKSSKTRTQGINQLANLWERRQQRADTQEQIIELAELYGLALAWRREGRGDGQLAHDILLEIEPQVDDPARRNMLRAVANLSLP